ncbi:MAG: ribosomal-protein-alanine N-acetyltransferase [Elusimicrobia bacterium RIFOXYA2_FULL_40_6]|nr:MAG: ribosomal-protein-alanine N-acetyltransferase [Elusimicrobia bacterium RIFOXYA2_FULL_40_6]
MQQAAIEHLTEADISHILEIENESFPDPWTKEKFQQELVLKFSHFFTAKISGEIVGYIGLWHISDEGNIVNIAVKKNRRKEGIASRLLEHILGVAAQKNITNVYLEVRSKNLPAQNLYKKFGFEASYKRHAYYSDDDAIVMHKKIK